MRKLLSLLETQLSGATVVLVAPDAAPLGVLQALVLGEDPSVHARHTLALGGVRRLELASGADAAAAAAAAPASPPCPRPPACR